MIDQSGRMLPPGGAQASWRRSMRRKGLVRALGGLPHAAQRRIVGPWKEAIRGIPNILREALVEIGARVVRRGRCVMFRLSVVAVCRGPC